MSDSGKSSKFEVSSMLLISMEMAAGRSLCRQDGENHKQEITGRVVRQVPVEFCAMSLLQSRTQAKIGQLHVSLWANEHEISLHGHHGACRYRQPVKACLSSGLTLESSSRLSGLMSLWMKPSWWMESIARTVSAM
ncbi:hypothetical protein EYF80_033774 [Liparis tanakae]|uniref:Uncharacterized protein n=1 Tax=Liparis tanakae TaxID=230148 RepID=A0A4Z2GRG3_9TELE|nr:hypothetical protein EYF80_033774 [Liparis tanakae]